MNEKFRRVWEGKSICYFIDFLFSHVQREDDIVDDEDEEEKKNIKKEFHEW